MSGCNPDGTHSPFWQSGWLPSFTQSSLVLHCTALWSRSNVHVVPDIAIAATSSIPIVALSRFM